MNEDQTTTLLDRLTEDVEVSHPPVSATAEAGRRRLRWRHHAQVGATAAAVLALAGGGLVLQARLGGSGQPAATSHLQSSTGEALVGRWLPIELNGEPVDETDTLDFSRSHGDVAGYRGRLVWGAQDDCNGAGGTASIGSAGQFSIVRAGITQMGCFTQAPYTVFDAVMHARHIQITSGRLVLASASGTRLGVFVRLTEQPATPQALPGTVPTKAQLLGTWRPLEVRGRGVSAQRRVDGAPLVVTFHGETAVPAIANATDITWRGYDGCNWTSGWVLYVRPEGAFSTRGDATTLRGCLGIVGRSDTGVGVVERATQVRLVDGNLHFFDAKEQLLGVFANVHD